MPLFVVGHKSQDLTVVMLGKDFDEAFESFTRSSYDGEEEVYIRECLETDKKDWRVLATFATHEPAAVLMHFGGTRRIFPKREKQAA